MDAPSWYARGYGEDAARVEPGLADFTVATSVLDEAAVEVEPRGSLVCAAWKRETLVFEGPGAAGTGVSAEGSGRLRSGPGVGGGEMNATFFCTSTCAPFELLLLLLVLREFRPAESDSTMRGGAAVTVTSTICTPSLPSGGGSGAIEPVGVGCADDSVDEEVGSSTGGNGRDDISGSGLKTAVGVPDDRGGHPGRGGS